MTVSVHESERVSMGWLISVEMEVSMPTNEHVDLLGNEAQEVQTLWTPVPGALNQWAVSEILTPGLLFGSSTVSTCLLGSRKRQRMNALRDQSRCRISEKMRNEMIVH